MGSIPLVALDQPQTPPPQSIITPFAQVSQMQGQQIQNQQEQVKLQQQKLAMQDQEVLRGLIPEFTKKDASGKPIGYDFDGLIGAAQGKVMPQTLFDLQKQQSTMRQAAATASKDELENQATINKNLYEKSEALKGITDPQQRQNAYSGILAYAAQNHVPTDDWTPRVPDNDTITAHQAELGMHAQTLADAKVVAETGEATAKGTQAKAEADKAAADAAKARKETELMAQYGTPQQQEAKYIALTTRANLKQPLAPEDRAFIKAYEHNKTLIPMTNLNVQAQLLDPQAKQMAAQLYQQTGQLPAGMRSPAMSAGILNQAAGPQGGAVPDIATAKRNYAAETAVQKSATSGKIGANITAFNTAIAHAGQLQKAADALGNGDIRGLNAIGNQLGYQFGSDKVTNFNVIKNALAGEISKVFKGGEASDAEIKAVQEPFSTANSPAQLKGAINNAITLMNSKRDALKQQVDQGMQGKPNFQGENQQPAGAMTITLPSGKKVVIQ